MINLYQIHRSALFSQIINSPLRTSALSPIDKTLCMQEFMTNSPEYVVGSELWLVIERLVVTTAYLIRAQFYQI